MMKGLFGKSMKPDYMMPAYSMPQSGTITDGMNLGTPAPQQQRQPGFWQGGGKFTGRDALAAALAAVGDGLRGWAGGSTGAVESLIAGRAAPGQQAAALAAEQRKRAAELADYEAKKGIDARYQMPDAPKPGSFEWWSDPSRTPEEKARFAEYRDVNTPDEPRMITLPDGRAIFGTMDEIRSIIGGQGAAGGGQPPPRPVGRLTPIGGGGVSNGTGSF